MLVAGDFLIEAIIFGRNTIENVFEERKKREKRMSAMRGRESERNRMK